MTRMECLAQEGPLSLPLESSSSPAGNAMAESPSPQTPQGPSPATTPAAPTAAPPSGSCAQSRRPRGRYAWPKLNAGPPLAPSPAELKRNERLYRRLCYAGAITDGMKPHLFRLARGTHNDYGAANYRRYEARLFQLAKRFGIPIKPAC